MYWPLIFRKSLNPYSSFNGSIDIEQAPPPLSFVADWTGLAGLPACRCRASLAALPSALPLAVP
jgi:hypothetical protein